MSTNQQAFASNTYNPNIDDRALALYQLMNNRPDDDALLDSYRTIVQNYPTHNLYSGVLFNPRACEVDANSSLLDDIRTQLQEQYDGIVTRGTPTGGTNTGVTGDPTGTPYVPTSDQTKTLDEWRDQYPQLVNNLNQVDSTLSTYRDHTDRLVSNFTSFTSMAQTNIGNTVAVSQASTTASGNTSQAAPFDLSNLGLPTSAGSTGGGNPCLQFGDMFGSLFAAGQKMMDQMSKALMGLLGAIGNPMALIQQAMSSVMGMVNQIMSKIQAEITKLASSIMNMMKMGLAQLMQFMPNDPCLKSIIGGLLTQGAKSIMGGIL
jgi:hypothetical protein